MKQRILTLRYLISTLALSAAFSLVCVAQQTAPKPAPAAGVIKPAAFDHGAMMVADWTRAKEFTKEYLDAMPEDGMSFKPSAGMRWPTTNLPITPTWPGSDSRFPSSSPCFIPAIDWRVHRP